MSVKVASSRLTESSITRFSELYQHVLRNVLSFQKLGDRLIREADAARSFRHIDKIEEMGRLLSNIPIREYQLIGQYYVGWAGCLKGETPQKLLEEVVEQSETYKAKAFISLAGIEAQRGDPNSELRCFTQALKYANNASTRIEALRGIVVIKAKEGFNKQALQDLEQMLPLARYGDVRTYYDYLNSLAVELGESGRVEEAQNVCRITLASPYAFAYPEWRETEQDLALRGYKSRSLVPIIQSFPGNVAYMPERELHEPSDRQPTPIPSEGSKSTPVVNIEEWKKKMVKEPNGPEDDLIPKDLDKLTDKDMIIRIFQLSSQQDLTSEQLRDILEYVIKVSSEKK
jgi:tetratricopeptide (TPR) repeat protein